MASSLLMVVLVAGCSFGFSSPYQAYSSLDADQLALVIPDTERWAHGTLCPGGGDCSGAMTAEWIQETTWVPVADVLEVSVEGDWAIVTMSRGTAPSRFPGAEDVSFRLWGDDHIESLEEAVSLGLELWVGYVATDQGVVLGFDTEERVAAVGARGAAFVAEPVVRFSQAAGISPQQYFKKLSVGPAPSRLLTSSDPGLPSKTFEPATIRQQAMCIRHGRNGPLLVFPEGTVVQRDGRRSGVDVLEGWSGLETIPFGRSLEEGQRIELVGQSTTTEALGVSAFLRCGTDAIFVEQIRIVEAG